VAFAPGVSVAEVARRFEVATSLIYKWRQQSRASDGQERTQRPSGTHVQEAQRTVARVLNKNSELRPSSLRPTYLP
jgi:transposase-like protein